VEYGYTVYLALIMALAINMKMEITINMTAAITALWGIARVEGFGLPPFVVIGKDRCVSGST